MIFGIGTDIVRIERMQKNLERYGEDFARRILADNELEEFRGQARRAHFLAKRFAAKEAAAKALGLGFSNGLGLRHIHVEHDAQGKPLLQFTGQALQLITQEKITASHLSLADDGDYAVAFVTLSRD